MTKLKEFKDKMDLVLNLQNAKSIITLFTSRDLIVDIFDPQNGVIPPYTKRVEGITYSNDLEWYKDIKEWMDLQHQKHWKLQTSYLYFRIQYVN